MFVSSGWTPAATIDLFSADWAVFRNESSADCATLGDPALEALLKRELRASGVWPGTSPLLVSTVLVKHIAGAVVNVAAPAVATTRPSPASASAASASVATRPAFAAAWSASSSATAANLSMLADAAVVLALGDAALVVAAAPAAAAPAPAREAAPVLATSAAIEAVSTRSGVAAVALKQSKVVTAPFVTLLPLSSAQSPERVARRPPPAPTRDGTDSDTDPGADNEEHPTGLKCESEREEYFLSAVFPNSDAHIEILLEKFKTDCARANVQALAYAAFDSVLRTSMFSSDDEHAAVEELVVFPSAPWQKLARSLSEINVRREVKPCAVENIQEAWDVIFECSASARASRRSQKKDK